VAVKYIDAPNVIEIYGVWLDKAHEIRVIRNRLFHGRWGVEQSEQKVANVIGLPTSPEQQATLYTIDELQTLLNSIRILRSQLNEIRESWEL
jgi:hypothetical protein